jgi:hypothetical protein
MADTEPIPIRLSPVQDVSGGEAERETETETETEREREAEVVTEREETEREAGGDDCVVCFEPTTEKSTQLFLYNCRCVYFVHEACFRRWRTQTGTDRVCLICREGLESFEEDEEGREGEEGGEREPLLRARGLRLGPRLAEIPVRAVHRPAVQAAAPNWFWNTDTEQKMLLVAVACFLLVLLFHLRHTSVVVYTGEETTKLLLNTL